MTNDERQIECNELWFGGKKNTEHTGQEEGDSVHMKSTMKSDDIENVDSVFS